MKEREGGGGSGHDYYVSTCHSAKKCQLRVDFYSRRQEGREGRGKEGGRAAKIRMIMHLFARRQLHRVRPSI